MSSGIQSVISDSNVVTNHPTMAEPFGNALIELAKENDRIVGLSADLAKYTDIHIFRDAFPDRFYNVGMSEQLMMCAASGLAKEGFIPFATTYATFIARRCYDFISQAICEHNTNVKIIGGLPGLQSGYGPSHQAILIWFLMRMPSRLRTPQQTPPERSKIVFGSENSTEEQRFEGELQNAALPELNKRR